MPARQQATRLMTMLLSSASTFERSPAGDQPADRTDGNRTAGRRPTRRGTRTRGSAAARGGTTRGRRAVEASPSPAVLTVSRAVVPAIQGVTDQRLTIMATTTRQRTHSIHIPACQTGACRARRYGRRPSPAGQFRGHWCCRLRRIALGAAYAGSRLRSEGRRETPPRSARGDAFHRRQLRACRSVNVPTARRQAPL
jgi:hypothetical protein